MLRHAKNRSIQVYRELKKASALAALGIVLLLSACADAQQWEVSKARGATRGIAFNTDEGTWMSVDISPDSQSIVFDLLGHIYRVPISGGKAESLTQSSGIAINYHPRYSPDGRHIAFISDRDGQDNLWVMNADGTDARPVFLDTDSRIAEPAWMPDGKSIVATRRFRTAMGFYRVSAEIWRFPVRGKQQPDRLVASNGLQRHWPSPSPDGRYVYFHTMKSSGEGHHIQRLDLQGATGPQYVSLPRERALTYPSYAPPLGEAAPQVSPDGNWLAFIRKIPSTRLRVGTREHEPRSGLWIRNLATGDEQLIMDPVTTDAMDWLFTHKTRVAPGYNWSPDSQSVVISQGGKIRLLEISSKEVSTIPFDARVERTISEMARYTGPLTGSVGSPVVGARWATRSPDGGQLAFEALGRLWIKRLPNGEPVPVTDLTVSDEVQMTPAWSMDGEWLIYTTWQAPNNGHVWRIRPAGGVPERITSAPGRYLYPFFGKTADEVYFNVWPSELVYSGEDSFQDGSSQYWELHRTDLRSNSIDREIIREPGPIVRGSALDDASIVWQERRSGIVGDARRYLAAGASLPRPYTTLYAQGVGRSKAKQELLRLEGTPKSVAVSPDKQWAAVEQRQDIYLVPVPEQPTDDDLNTSESEAIDALNSARSIRLTLHGGAYPRWRDVDTLEYLDGAEFVTYDVTTQRVDRIPLGLQVSAVDAAGSSDTLLVLEGAKVIVGRNQQVIESADVLIDGNRIECVGTCNVPISTHRLNLHGHTIMPGWVDVHSHHTHSQGEFVETKRASSAAYLAYGTTTTNDPGVLTPSEALALREMTAAGRVIGPRTLWQGEYIRCGGQVSGWQINREIRSRADAAEIVERLANRGATLIKSFQLCTRAQRQMLVDAARARGVGVTVEAQDFSLVLGAIMDGHPGWEHWLQHVPIYKDVSRFLGRAGAHYSGQIYQAGYPFAGSTEYWAARDNYWKDTKAKAYTPWSQLVTRNAPTGKPLSRFSWPILADGAAEILESGGRAVLGGHSELPGVDAHWEVWALAAAMGPLRALESASYSGAHFLGIESEIGSLEVGKLADLVVLREDPLTSIRNTMSIRYVMKDGVLYDGESLNRIFPNPAEFGARPWLEADFERPEVLPDDLFDLSTRQSH